MASNDPYRYFRIEARELVEQLGSGLLELERRADSEQLRTLLRHAHTLKGAARVVRLVEVADRAHAIEERLEPHRAGSGPVEAADVSAILRLLDEIRELLRGLRAPGEAAATADEPEERQERPSGSHETVQVRIEEMDSLMQSVLRARIEAHALSRQDEAVGRFAATAERLVVGLERASSSAPDALLALRRATSSAARLRDELAALGQEHGRHTAALTGELDELDERTSEMRLVEAATIRNDLERTVRDTALAAGSRAELVWSGDARMDAHVLRAVREALLHSVRNAVAHGIERAEERLAAGKASTGRVQVEVRRAGYRVWFRCIDDGRGIDAARVREVALRRQLLTRDEAAELDGAGLAALLLRGGVSTARKTTHMSGRGVGLDAVRASVESVGGVIRIHSEPGRGTTLELGVPLSRAQLPVLEIESGAAHALVPLDAVVRTLRFAEGDEPVPDDAGMAVLDGAPVRVLRLASVLGLPEEERGSYGAVATYLPRGRGAPAEGGSGDPAVDTDAPADGSTAGVVVDTGAGVLLLLGRRIGSIGSAIVRPLPRLAVAAPWVGGAMLGPDGVPRIVLAPHALDRAPRGSRAGRTADPTLPILIVDDSLTTRMLEQSILESAGYEVDLAVSAEEALHKMGRTSYALLLVDVEMPGMDGFTLLETIRSDPSIPDVPCILVTSRESAADRARGEEVGARHYVVKGEFDQETLMRRIQELVR